MKPQHDTVGVVARPQLDLLGVREFILAIAKIRLRCSCHFKVGFDSFNLKGIFLNPLSLNSRDAPVHSGYRTAANEPHSHNSVSAAFARRRCHDVNTVRIPHSG